MLGPRPGSEAARAQSYLEIRTMQEIEAAIRAHPAYEKLISHMAGEMEAAAKAFDAAPNDENNRRLTAAEEKAKELKLEIALEAHCTQDNIEFAIREDPRFKRKPPELVESRELV